MARPFDSANYVGQTANPPCNPGAQWVVVVDGSYRKCFSQRADAENYYNSLTGSAGNGAGAYDGGSPGNAATATPVIPITPPIPQTNSAIGSLLSNNALLLGGIGLAAFLVLRRR